MHRQVRQVDTAVATRIRVNNERAWMFAAEASRSNRSSRGIFDNSPLAEERRGKRDEYADDDYRGDDNCFVRSLGAAIFAVAEGDLLYF